MALLFRVPTEAPLFQSSATPFLHYLNHNGCKIPANVSFSIIFPKKSRYSGTCAAAYNNSSNKSKASGSILTDLQNDHEDKLQYNNVSGVRKNSSTFDLHLDLDLVHQTSKTQTADSLTPAELKKFASQLEQTYRKSPTVSPKEALGDKWREYQGSKNWEGLLDPLDANLRREIVKYGEFAQATYDAFDFDSHSKYCGSCRYNRHKMLDKVDLGRTGYKITKYLYAMSNVHLPKVFGRSDSMDPWSKDSNWMGYVAVSTDEEVKRLGRRDIVVAWRGTVTQLEWLENLKLILHPVGDAMGFQEPSAVKAERGFLSMYTSKNEKTRYNKLSASDQVMCEVRRLVEMYRDREEELSITITGHSLGGALGLLNAYEMAAKGVNRSRNGRDIPITVFSFGAPRVGNMAFRDRLNELGVKTLRVVSEQDMVPKMPGILLNEGMDKLQAAVAQMPKTDAAGSHNLESYLHLLDGFQSSSTPFRPEAKRDVALVNKSSDLLLKEVMIPANWYQLQHKGLVRNCYGRWVQPERDAEDVPSPKHVQISCSSLGFDI
eukprot:Gb_16886 [translate_table: standard]